MNPVLLVDFGSTRTKVTAVDTDARRLLGTASAPTTVKTGVGQGLARALDALRETTGPLEYAQRLACSSAAGGLRMAASGLVPRLTAEAARLACLGAGARVVKAYAYEMTDEDIEEIDALSPDIFLLTGGTDGGNRVCIEHNARMLAGCKAPFPILLAGNRNSAAKCEHVLKEAGRQVIRCENVMPGLNELNIEPVQQHIRALFLERIVHAKGLEGAGVPPVQMPTPAAVLAAMQLLAGGTKEDAGLGDLMAVDVGGATTDVYSMATGAPASDATLLKGLPEPYAKRTVEGDLGMRYSAPGVLDALGGERLAQLAGLSEEQAAARARQLPEAPEALPETPDDEALDFALAYGAIETAAARHAGRIEQVYTPAGLTLVQTGKDLTHVARLVLTGGALVSAPHGPEAARAALAGPAHPAALLPRTAAILVDKAYILSAMGLLAREYPACALSIMKKELEPHGTAKQTP